MFHICLNSNSKRLNYCQGQLVIVTKLSGKLYWVWISESLDTCQVAISKVYFNQKRWTLRLFYSQIVELDIVHLKRIIDLRNSSIFNMLGFKRRVGRIHLKDSTNVLGLLVVTDISYRRSPIRRIFTHICLARHIKRFLEIPSRRMRLR